MAGTQQILREACAWVELGFDTAPHHAVLENQLLAVALLLQEGPNVNNWDKLGRAPLHLTGQVRSVNLDIVGVLLVWEANVDRKKECGPGPGQVAAYAPAVFRAGDVPGASRNRRQAFPKDELLVGQRRPV